MRYWPKKAMTSRILSAQAWGIPTRGGAAPTGGICVDARCDVTHRVGAVERVVHTRIDLDRHGIPSLLGRFGQLPARLCRRPVVFLSNENQQGRDRFVRASRTGVPV